MPKVEVQAKRPRRARGDGVRRSVAAGLPRVLKRRWQKTRRSPSDSIAEGHPVWYATISSTGRPRSTRRWPTRHADRRSVMSIGINDRQRMRTSGSATVPVAGVGNAVQIADHPHPGYRFEPRIPIIWVGLAPSSSSKMRTDFLHLNGLYREASKIAAASFLDIWTSFLDENERDAAYGPDSTGSEASDASQ